MLWFKASAGQAEYFLCLCCSLLKPCIVCIPIIIHTIMIFIFVAPLVLRLTDTHITVVLELGVAPGNCSQKVAWICIYIQHSDFRMQCSLVAHIHRSHWKMKVASEGMVIFHNWDNWGYFRSI